MIYLLFVSIPIAALLVWAAMFDQKRRRHEPPASHVGAAGRANRLATERRAEDGPLFRGPAAGRQANRRPALLAAAGRERQTRRCEPARLSHLVPRKDRHFRHPF
jgi:hypothetical protein